jgi:hypothetical protein
VTPSMQTRIASPIRMMNEWINQNYAMPSQRNRNKTSVHNWNKIWGYCKKNCVGDVGPGQVARRGTPANQQKCASAPHFRPKDFSLQPCAEANFAERNEIPRKEKARKDAAKFG